MQLAGSSISLVECHPALTGVTVRPGSRDRDGHVPNHRRRRQLAMLLWLALAIWNADLAVAQGHATLEPSTSSAGSGPAAEKVTGIGGFFFRAQNPAELAAWYERHLGVTRTPATYEEEPWHQEAGMTVLAPFPAGSNFFGNAEKQWMINFRVRNLDAMVAQLRRAGIDVDVDPTVHPNGRFARLTDPEGNPIQLWEDKRPETGR